MWAGVAGKQDRMEGKNQKGETRMKVKKWKGQLWLKIVTLIVAVLSCIGTILGATVMIISAGIRSEYNGNLDPLVQSMQDQMLHNYAAELVENAKRLEDSNSLDGSLQGYGDLTADEVALGWSLLEGSGISYAVDKVTFTVENGLEGTKVTRQTELAYGDESLRDQMRSNQDVTGQGIYYYDFFRNASYNYNTDSLQGICASSVYAHEIDNLNGDVDLIYDSQGYQFWYGAFNATDEENDDILYYDENGEPVVDVEYAQEEATGSQQEMILGDVESLPSGAYTFYRVYMMPDEETYELFARETIGAFSGGRNLYSLKPINLPEVLSRLQQRVDDVQFAVGQSDYLWVPYVLAECFTLIEQGYLPGFAISILLLIGSFLLLMTMSGHRTEDDEIHTRWIDRVPFIIYAAAAILGVALGVCGNIGICYLFYENMIGVSECVMLSLLVAVLWELLMFAFCMSVATRLKTGHFMEYTLWHWVTRPVRRLLDLIRENTKLSIRIALVLLVIGLVELLVISASMYSDAIIVWFFLYKILETGAIFYLVLMMNRLREGGRRVANGDYSQPIDTTHMIPVLAEHGADINRVGEGIALAVEEQMKSERLKTELITNVSHDIKTPLTSIINYVDLIQKQEITDPTLREYVAVLERQSARLKKLIEDLLEASKASTGNVEIHLERCDATVMVSQIVGEYQDKLQKNSIEVIVNQPEQPAQILADGRHLWRVLDNIMSNISKYTQEHTRVYISVVPQEEETLLIFKNISKYPLNISSDELKERFVRGDTSRNTEGHGLGLSIAESLTELMNGHLQITIDGDMFKITVSMKNEK